jgi:hypothetical protein
VDPEVARRYPESDVDGLFDLTRFHHDTRQIPPKLQRTILWIRRRL